MTATFMPVPVGIVRSPTITVAVFPSAYPPETNCALVSQTGAGNTEGEGAGVDVMEGGVATGAVVGASDGILEGAAVGEKGMHAVISMGPAPANFASSSAYTGPPLVAIKA
jgi:hypothetical protein